MAVVYLHKRNDTNEVFYVGIGNEIKRAFDKIGRTKYWKRIVEKYGYTVDIRVNDATWDEVIQIEKYLIAFYGRKDLRLGNLVNLTDGGEGALGVVISNETREKLSEAHKGITPWNKGIKQLEETKNKISLYQRNKEGVKGYTFHKKTNKFQAQIRVGGKKIYLGLFNTPSEAEEVYKNARIRYFA